MTQVGGEAGSFLRGTVGGICAATHASGDGGGSTSERQMSKAGSETKLPGDSLQDRARLEFQNIGA